ncbi:MAG TPA: hypothetical protein VKZ89_20170 [Thermobifida alba]|nr:hypothetical protein [Thermobifida alba]
MSHEPDLYEGELYVAPGERAPHVLQVVRRRGELRLVELAPVSEPMTTGEVADRYGYANPVWRYASLARETGPDPEVPVPGSAPPAKPPAPLAWWGTWRRRKDPGRADA